MKFTKLVAVALQSIARNSMRSILTMLGIIIGVGSVITLMALGSGSQTDIEGQVNSMGTNLIMVFPSSGMMGGVSSGAGSRGSFTLDDYDFIREHSTKIQGISPEIRINSQVIAGSNNWSTSISGVSLDYPTVRNASVASGTFFTERDVQTRNKVAIIGKTVARELFPGVDPIGQRIRIGNVPFVVLGVLTEKGQNAMGSDQDDTIITPYTTALYRLGDGHTVRAILISANGDVSLSEAKKEVELLLRAHRRIPAGQDNDFTLRDQSEINAMASSINSALTMLLSAIAGVSLLVGGIGIMNIMLVSVTERTREIGLRMALGARGSDVLIQFLIEAVILSLVGGILGVMGGVLLAYGLGSVMGSSVEISPSVIVMAVLFTGLVGVFFGFYPARKAARLNPIDALRYE